MKIRHLYAWGYTSLLVAWKSLHRPARLVQQWSKLPRILAQWSRKEMNCDKKAGVMSGRLI